MKAKEITPVEARCGVGPCPSIFQTNRGTFLVIGPIPATNDLPRNVRRKIGKGEVAIEVQQNVLPIK
ncbi:MAG: hypothetical protein WC666_00360 [Candidatus Paceibacterota bacterium]|jgi:hypothetical protein